MQIIRLLYIQSVFIKYNIDKLIWATPFKIIRLFFPWRWFQKNERPTGTEIREALITLGPIFVKFGQVLSTRRDLLPDDIAFELAKLQNRVPAFPSKIAIQIIEEKFKQPIDMLFKSFDKTPLAAASIAQVHAAELHTGEQVVVKILRPHIHQKIKKDISLMLFIAKIINLFPKMKRFKPIDIINEFKNTLENELNLMSEAANASQLKRNFLNSPLLTIPKVYWDYARDNIIVMERIHGIPISDIEALKAANINLKKLAERGVEIFFTQVFRDCFFHADMHPGNIFVSTEHPDDPQYIAVDFGIMGTLNPKDQQYLAQNFLAFFKRDYRQVAELHIACGWVAPTVRINELESAIRTVCEPIFEQPLSKISFGESLLKLFQTAQRFNMEIQPQLLLLQKTLLSVEGLGKQLYPELDLWRTAQPFLENWMKSRVTPKVIFQKLKEQLLQAFGVFGVY